MSTKTMTTADTIQHYIVWIRNEKMILDADLARLYNVETKVLIQSVKRNIARFPKIKV